MVAQIHHRKTLRYLLYFFLATITHYYTFKNSVAVGASLNDCISKFFYGLLCLAIAEWLYRNKQYQLFKILMTYRYIILLINFILPFIYYNISFPKIHTEQSINYLLWEFTEKHMLNYYVYFLYAATHLTVFYRVRYLRDIKLINIFITSFIFYGLSLVMNQNILKLTINLSAFIISLYYLYRNKFSILKQNAKRDILVYLYFLYTFVLIITFLSKQDNVNFSYIYSIILLTVTCVLYFNKELIKELYLGISYKIVVIVLMIIGASLSDFTLIELLQYLASSIILLLYIFGGIKVKKGLITGKEAVDGIVVKPRT